MPLVDVGSGTGGVFVDSANNTITWTSSTDHNFTDPPSFGTTVATSDSAGNTVTYSFDDGSGGGVQGLAVLVLGLNTSSDEQADFIINGVDVNLQTLIDAGQAELVPQSEWLSGFAAQAEGQIDPVTGNAAGAGGTQDTIVISFNFPITSLAINETIGGQGNFLTDIFTVCFTSGTFIETDHGKKTVEQLRQGDLVLTKDNGYQAIRWIGSTKVMSTGKMRPIRIVSGALGSQLPERDLLISRQHRMLVSSQIAERMFGGNVLIPAIKLTELPGIFVDESAEVVEYFHILFDQHEIIFAEGAPSESLYTGPEALKAVSPEAKAEILTLFPELADRDYTPEPAATIPSLAQQKKLVVRHAKNKKNLLQNLETGRAAERNDIPS